MLPVIVGRIGKAGKGAIASYCWYLQKNHFYIKLSMDYSDLEDGFHNKSKIL